MWARWRGRASRSQTVCFAGRTRDDRIHARVMAIAVVRAAPAVPRAAASVVVHHAVAGVHAVAAGVVVVEDDDRA